MIANVHDLGLIAYEPAWKLQRELLEQRADNRIGDQFLLCEHTPVITMGKSGKQNNLLVSAEELRRRGVDYFVVERGGDLTYHGPGQLVGYPIFKLARLREVQAFVRKMEESVIRALAQFGVVGERRTDHPGVFIGGAKVASIGAAVRRGVTYHGFALDVCTDLSYYRLINPCGMPEVAVTTIAREAGRDVSVAEVKPLIRSAFEDVFGLHLEDAAEPALLAGPEVAIAKGA
ncbi:MAG TPA: lipoyl(octanoyl) transferase LipB [Candidatus Eremiobacteraceae bacterium]|nr:lipoyl(octanoyl) transferase LipB [Candidatus Eremiobacteraceae bacterium]